MSIDFLMKYRYNRNVKRKKSRKGENIHDWDSGNRAALYRGNWNFGF